MSEQNEQIKNYISQARMQGISDQEIRNNLTAVGWHNDQINQGFANVAGGSLWSRPGFKISATALIVLILAGLGYFAYAKYSPAAVLDGLVNRISDTGVQLGSHHTVLSFSVKDSQLGNAGLNIAGDSTISGPALEQASMDVKFDVNANFQEPGNPAKVSFNANALEVRETNGQLFVNLSQVPELQSSLSQYGGWVKIDFNKLPAEQKQQIEQGLFSASSPEEVANYRQALQSLGQSKLVSYHLVGIQKIGGVYTYHYKLDIDKNALVEAVSAQAGSYFAQKGQIATLDAIKIYLNSLNFKQSDLWVGITDKQIHKLEIEISAPSISGLAARASGTVNAPLLSGNLDSVLAYDLSENQQSTKVAVPAKALDLSSYFSDGSQLPQLP